MDELADRLRKMPMPSRSEAGRPLDGRELDRLFASHLSALDGLEKAVGLGGFRKLRELATSRGVIDELAIAIYERSLFYSLEQDDMDGFCICANRLVNELYPTRDSAARPGVTALLLLFYALDAGRDGDFACLFYRLSDETRRCKSVQFALDVYMALKRCDYAGWGRLLETADVHQICIMKRLDPVMSRERRRIEQAVFK